MTTELVDVLGRLAPPILAFVLVKASVVLAGAWAVTTLLRRSSASRRHLVWAVAFGALALMPCQVHAHAAFRRRVTRSRWVPRGVQAHSAER
jgi:hypothetical protein